jgi:hypothetical protein
MGDSRSDQEGSAVAGLLDVVELLVPAGRWPAGVSGTVVEVLDSIVLVEISDEDGRTLDLLEVPQAAVDVVRRSQQAKRPVSGRG